MSISRKPAWFGVNRKAYPKLEGEVTADVAIVGGGITGLLAAYLLSRSGKKVVVLEADTLGSGATMYTTAFITQVIDTRLGDLMKMFGKKSTKGIWQAGGNAIRAIEAIVKKEKIACEFERCPAYLYASTARQFKRLEDEHRLAQRLGFATKLVSKNKLPFAPFGYRVVEDQAKFHPLKFLNGVAVAIMKSGGRIFEHSRTLAVGEYAEKRCIVKMARGSVAASDVIVATYMPFNKPAAINYKKAMYVSYVLEARVPKKIFAEGLYWDSDNPYHYFRIDRQGKSDRMILGGEDHRADIPVNPEKSFDALKEYLAGLLGNRRYAITRAWRGGVLESVDGLPFIGAYRPHQFVATAFSGNGMTFAMVSASMFRSMILKKKNSKDPWVPVFSPTRAFTAYRVAKKGIDYAGELWGGALKNTLRKKPASGRPKS